MSSTLLTGASSGSPGGSGLSGAASSTPILFPFYAEALALAGGGGLFSATPAASGGLFGPNPFSATLQDGLFSARPAASKAIQWQLGSVAPGGLFGAARSPLLPPAGEMRQRTRRRRLQRNIQERTLYKKYREVQEALKLHEKYKQLQDAVSATLSDREIFTEECVQLYRATCASRNVPLLNKPLVTEITRHFLQRLACDDDPRMVGMIIEIYMSLERQFPNEDEAILEAAFKDFIQDVLNQINADICEKLRKLEAKHPGGLFGAAPLQDDEHVVEEEAPLACKRRKMTVINNVLLTCGLTLEDLCRTV